MKWKSALPICILLVFLAVLPQILLNIQRGSDFNGSIVYLDFDEVAYAAYLRSVIEGEPRKNNSYTAENANLPESLFSIQFLPAYVVAVPSRLLGLSAEQAMFLVSIFSAFFSALSLCWLFGRFTNGEDWFAAYGALFVLGFWRPFGRTRSLQRRCWVLVMLTSSFRFSGVTFRLLSCRVFSCFLVSSGSRSAQNYKRESSC